MARRRLRSGFTTGTAAAAAAKAAVMSAFGLEFDCVDVSLPDGGSLEVPVALVIRQTNGPCKAEVIKDAGDDPDVTNKARIAAEVEISVSQNGSGSLDILGGEGVGQVTKPGLPVEPGNPAINPTPRQMIAKAVRQALAWAAPDKQYCVTVTISVKKGEELARRTLNPRLGVLGGISILGTTGLVKPFSHEAYTETIDLGLSVARAEGVSEAVLTTGGKSESGPWPCGRPAGNGLCADSRLFRLRPGGLRGGGMQRHRPGLFFRQGRQAGPGPAWNTPTPTRRPWIYPCWPNGWSAKALTRIRRQK